MLPIRVLTALTIALCAALSACGRASDAQGGPSNGAANGAEVEAHAHTEQPKRTLPRVMFLGDSLTAGKDLDAEQSFPAIVTERLRAEGRPISMINAGVSGDTSAGGAARIEWLMGQRPDVVVLELGANDGLRGLPVEATRKNLREIVVRARAGGARVLLLGMKLPPNYGVEYLRDFEAMFPELARELDLPLVPFLLEGVAGQRELNLSDGMHPNADGQKRVAENVLPFLRELLAQGH